MQAGENTNRIAYFDHLRILATFLIMLLHTAAYHWYDTDISSTSWLILNGWKTLTDHAVLLFIMISGSLFLGRDVPVKKIFSKYVLRMACAFIFWSFIYALAANFRSGIRSIFDVTLSSHYHLWFIPMIAGLYICLPVLRQFVKTDKILRYFLLISFIFAFILPNVLNILSDFGSGLRVSGYLGGLTLARYAGFINDRLSDAKIYMITGYAFYFLTGYFLNKAELTRKCRVILYILGAAGLLVTYALTTMDFFRTGTPSDTYHYNFSIGVVFSAVATFVLFKNIIRAPESGGGKFIRMLSKYSFGAYLIHALIIEQIALRLGLNALTFSPVLSVPVIAIITFVLSFAISALLNRIPFINKYIV